MNYKYLDQTDLPSDVDGILGVLRRELARAYNTSRTREDRMTLLRDVLLFTLTRIDDIDYGNLPDYKELIKLNAALKGSNTKLAKANERKKEMLKTYLKEAALGSQENKEEKNSGNTRKRPAAKSRTRNKQAKNSSK